VVEVPGYQPPAEASISFAGDRLTARGPTTYQAPANTHFSSIPANVLLVAAGPVDQLRAILQAYPDLSLIDIYPADIQTPTLSELVPYNTVIVIANYAFADSTALGDVLADYLDQGGSVIQTVPTFYGNGWGLTGRFIDEGYSPLTGSGDWFTLADLGNFDPSHPIMQGVQSASDSLRQVVDLNSEADLVAEWTDDEFIATKGSVVALNVFLADGYYWTGDIGLIVHNSITWLQTQAEVPWLTESPVEGNLAPAETQTIDVTFDAGVPEIVQPGLYTARLKVFHNTIHSVPDVPVVMNVTVPDAYGKLDGIVNGLGYCDQQPAPLTNLSLLVTGSSGITRTVQTDAAGAYQLWLNQAESPLSLSVEAADHLPVIIDGITLTAGITHTQNVDLRWARPCLTLSQSTGLTQTVVAGEFVTTTLTISNSGAADAQFTLVEFPQMLNLLDAAAAQALQSTGQVHVVTEPKMGLIGLCGG
jgi:hypothetical protein